MDRDEINKIAISDAVLKDEKILWAQVRPRANNDAVDGSRATGLFKFRYDWKDQHIGNLRPIYFNMIVPPEWNREALISALVTRIENEIRATQS